MDVKISLNLNIAATEERLKKAAEKAILVTSEAALQDCNYYCKQDQEGLIGSSLTHSEPEKGILRWQTIYARKQYYLDAARKDKNPNARKMWAHHAASVHGSEWLLRMQKAFARFAKED